MIRQRTLLTMLVAAILAVVAGVLPSSARAHAGHGHSLLATPAILDAAAIHRSADILGDLDGFAADEAAPPVAHVSNDNGAAPDLGAGCVGSCCCPTGGAGCAAPALVAVPATAPVPDPEGVDFDASASAAPAEALGDRLPKPPRA